MIHCTLKINIELMTLVFEYGTKLVYLITRGKLIYSLIGQLASLLNRY